MSLRLQTRVAAVVGGVVVLSGLPSALVVPALPPQPLGCHAHPSGPPLRYLVLFSVSAPEPDTTRTIREACGTSTAYYPEIGVAVATSTEPRFASRLGLDRAYSAQAAAEPAGSALDNPPHHLPQVEHGRAPDRSAEQWDMELINGPQARAVDPGSPEVVVGVLDSGIDATHPDLTTAVDTTRSAGCLSGRPDPRSSAWRPTTSAHGTHVAGTIAAADDGRGITGVAPGVRLASVKVVDDDGFIYPEYAICAFMWAAKVGLRIANSSYFIDPWLRTCSDVSGQAIAYEAVRRAVEYATAQGVLSIAAMGNERMDLASPPQDQRSSDTISGSPPRSVDDACDVLPAQLPGVVAVSAVGAYGDMSEYSSFGLGVVAVTAPGGDTDQRPWVSSSGCVLSTILGGYGYACGTSMAAAHASGVAALLASSRPRAGPEELAALLRRQADPLPCPTHSDCTGERVNSFSGHGLVDALEAVVSHPASRPHSPDQEP
ncbi:MAG: S8 family peptidase [Pseudonocardiaceae bacterium]